MKKTRKKVDHFIERTSTTFFTYCPFETKDEDKVGSLEVDLTTGEYYCHNCHIQGNIEDLDDETQETIEFGERVGEQYE